jgi:hypothetical protein
MLSALDPTAVAPPPGQKDLRPRAACGNQVRGVPGPRVSRLNRLTFAALQPFEVPEPRHEPAVPELDPARA